MVIVPSGAVVVMKTSCSAEFMGGIMERTRETMLPLYDATDIVIVLCSNIRLARA